MKRKQSTDLQKYIKSKLIKSTWKPLLLTKSITRAVREQSMSEMFQKLETYIPDLSDQYEGFQLENSYWVSKVRAMHAFQISLVLKAINILHLKNKISIVDIGDSSGTHLLYLNRIFEDNGWQKGKMFSINMDSSCVQKIRSKGLEAECCRAEELHQKGIFADLFLCFETLEHLFSPIDFLKNISSIPDQKGFVITVPYLKQSRIGLATF